MNKLLLFIIVLAAVLLGIVWFLGNREDKEVSSPQSTLMPIQPTILPISVLPQPEQAVAPKNLIISITDSGFNPAEVVINAGDTVRFLNQSSQGRWPASAVHPTHELYPGSSISKCGSPEPMAIFDACRDLQKGEGFFFTFNNKGTWPYHDHLAPSAKGKIIVR